MRFLIEYIQAGYLTRALAFVTFALRHAGRKHVSVLFLVSPVKVYDIELFLGLIHLSSSSLLQVLAGVDIEHTLEFLRQLAEVHTMVDGASAKSKAAHEVIERGESHLYAMAVKFRQGLVKVQAAARLYLGKKHQASLREATVAVMAPIEIEPSVGTRFLKEFDGFGVFEGVIKSVTGGVYVVYYPQDNDEEELGTNYNV
jgi:hypothetical protein